MNGGDKGIEDRLLEEIKDSQVELNALKSVATYFHD